MRRTLPARLRAFAAALALAAAILPAHASLERVTADLQYLASEKLEGRLTGTEGERLAAEYLVAELGKIGAEPLPGMDNFLQPFDFTRGVEVAKEGGTELTVTGPDGAPVAFKLGEKFRPMGYSGNGDYSGELVFAGYGLTLPEENDLQYDSYAGLDVKGKAVLVMRYAPEGIEEKTREELMRYATFDRKVEAARDAGAAAIIMFGGPNSDNAGRLLPFSGGDSDEDDIIVGSVSGDGAEALFAHIGKTAKDVQTAFDTPEAPAGFNLEGVSIKLGVNLDRRRITGHNVLAMLPATVEGAGPEGPMLGAHYDHLGRGELGGSLAAMVGKGEIHYGADDNASGTTAVLEAMRTIAEQYPVRPRPVYVGFWSGEELGLLGAEHYVANDVVPTEQLYAYVNLDMVGRMKETELLIQGTGSSPEWEKVLDKTNEAFELDLTYSKNPNVPTDSAAFYRGGVPALQFFTGLHEQYHRPADTADLVNYEGVLRSGRYAAALAMELAHRGEAMPFEQYRRAGLIPGRTSERAYLGIVPDYAAAEGKGLALASVAEDGPAGKAGLKAGDRVVKLGKFDVTAMYDLMIALESLEIGETVDAVVLRDGKETTLPVKLEARP
ncbi:MAG: M20/M25/M40 family metallo-hydrolase [Candidatus Sumerlaeia bacterium]|nr:M20/M25/M40 family metallo-hydrolase [Candidatus Sumerlaeia bacterium]